MVHGPDPACWSFLSFPRTNQQTPLSGSPALLGFCAEAQRIFSLVIPVALQSCWDAVQQCRGKIWCLSSYLPPAHSLPLAPAWFETFKALTKPKHLNAPELTHARRQHSLLKNSQAMFLLSQAHMTSFEVKCLNISKCCLLNQWQPSWPALRLDIKVLLGKLSEWTCSDANLYLLWWTPVTWTRVSNSIAAPLLESSIQCLASDKIRSLEWNDSLDLTEVIYFVSSTCFVFASVKHQT